MPRARVWANPSYPTPGWRHEGTIKPDELIFESSLYKLYFIHTDSIPQYISYVACTPDFGSLRVHVENDRVNTD